MPLDQAPDDKLERLLREAYKKGYIDGVLDGQRKSNS